MEKYLKYTRKKTQPNTRTLKCHHRVVTLNCQRHTTIAINAVLSYFLLPFFLFNTTIKSNHILQTISSFDFIETNSFVLVKNPFSGMIMHSNKIDQAI